MSSRQPRSALGANGSTSRRGSAVSALSVPVTNTFVADVQPTYTLRGVVRCVETINDRIAWTAEEDGTLKIRSLPKGTELKVLRGRPRTKCAALLYMEAQQQLWAAFEDGFVRVYSVVQSELVSEFSATETPGAAATALLEVEGMVFLAGEDGSLTQWDCQSLRRLRALPGHLSSIRCLGCYMGPTGSVIFSGSDDSTVKAWDPYLESSNNSSSSGNCMFVFSGHRKGAVRAIEVVNAVNQMWTAGDDATVRVWNLESLDCVAVLKGTPQL
ncbi:uncharacterized WD repeat-containing protein alr3466-like [Bactrocera neohumeralis]|uniref:uncharacterized WD repeat-containing protein alr3466-like n=1 Tax=Bactrocera neohumeralis TaxID=98809 RepID=UPI00216587A0|nr:uncharacterized WD repeat-containing protein alr3466-like [Bactrocera neohumeralis]